MVHLFFVRGGIKHRDLLLGFPLLYHYLPGREESLQKKASDTHLMPLATQKLTLSRLLCHAQLNPLELANADILATQCHLLFDELANGFAVVEYKGLLG